MGEFILKTRAARILLSVIITALSAVICATAGQLFDVVWIYATGVISGIISFVSKLAGGIYFPFAVMLLPFAKAVPPSVLIILINSVSKKSGFIGRCEFWATNIVFIVLNTAVMYLRFWYLHFVQ